jgi:hypothetical protein
MNTAPPSLPSIKSLYYIDPTIQRAIGTCLFFLFAAAGIKWATQPMPNAIPIEKSPFDIWIADLGPMVALIVATLAFLILIRRYLLVRKILSQGTPIKGTVVEVDMYEREAPRSETRSAFDVAKIRSYYTTIRYNCRGADRQIRLKLPFSPSTYKIAKDNEVDLILLDSAPKSPLIREMYLGGIAPRSLGWKRFL